MNLALPFPHFRIPFHRPAELRIDVDPSSADRDELPATIYQRIHSPGDKLYGLPAFGLPDPDLRIRVRQTDGEFYAYVADVRRQCLVGYTVLNRLVEVGRRADRHVRSPHSRYQPQYQRRGIATAVYEWALGTGICLMTGARQSAGAHALWLGLQRRYVSGFVDHRNRRLTYLGSDVSPGDFDQLQTRMFLLGPKWSLTDFCSAADVVIRADSTQPPARRAHP